MCARKCLQSVCASSSWLRGSLSTSPSEARPLPPQGTQPIFLGSQLHTANIFSHEDTSTNPSVSLSVKKATEKKQSFFDTYSQILGLPSPPPLLPKTTSFLSQSPQKLSLFLLNLNTMFLGSPLPSHISNESTSYNNSGHFVLTNHFQQKFEEALTE